MPRNTFNKHIKSFAMLALFYELLSIAVDFNFIEYITHYIDPINLAIVRTFIIATIFLMFHRIVVGPFRIKKEDQLRFLVAGGSGLGLYVIAEALGVSLTSASLSSLLLSGVTILTIVADRIVNKVPITPKKAVGVTASVCGVAIIIFGVSDSHISGTLLGILILLIAIVLWTIYLLLVKPLHDKYSTTTVTTGVFLAAAIVDIPIFILYNPGATLNVPAFQWVLVLFFTVVFFAIAQFMYVFALKHVSLALASMALNLTPFLTIICSLIVFGSIPNTVQLFGGLVIVLAVVLVSTDEFKNE